ncbi:MAG: hypothetical protein RIS45_762 [Planctomycetota bacterium]|jgi:hypothetical protein
MAISFTNTAGTGYAYSEDTGDTGTTDVPALATPSDAGSGKLLIGIWGAGADTSFSAQTPVLANAASTTEIINQAYAPDQVGELHCLYKLLASSPTNCNWNATPSANRKRVAAALIFDGIDTGSPIRSYAASTGNSGAVVTFPDTSSASAGDVVLRVCQILKQDWSYTYNGTTVGTVIRNSVPATYHDGVFYGYDTHSSGSTPGTKTATWSGTVRWIAATIVIAAAGGSTVAPKASFYRMLRNL